MDFQNSAFRDVWAESANYKDPLATVTTLFVTKIFSWNSRTTNNEETPFLTSSDLHKHDRFSLLSNFMHLFPIIGTA